MAVRRDLAKAGIGFGIFDMDTHPQCQHRKDMAESGLAVKSEMVNGYANHTTRSSPGQPSPPTPPAPSFLRLPYALISPEMYSHSDGVARLSLSRVYITTELDGQRTRIKLSETLHVPSARENLLSLGHIDAAGGRVICMKGRMTLYHTTDMPIAITNIRRGLYYMDVQIETHETAYAAIKLKHTWTWEEWHRRLGYISVAGLQKLHGKNLVDGFSLIDSPQDFECEACIQSKLTQRPCRERSTRITPKDSAFAELEGECWNPVHVH